MDWKFDGVEKAAFGVMVALWVVIFGTLTWVSVYGAERTGTQAGTMAEVAFDKSSWAVRAQAVTIDNDLVFSGLHKTRYGSEQACIEALAKSEELDNDIGLLMKLPGVKMVRAECVKVPGERAA
jgi:hypothetical protein